MVHEKRNTFNARSKGASSALSWVVILAISVTCGCNQGNLWSGPQASSDTLNQQQQFAQLQEMQRRSGQLDANNNDLHAQLAQSQRSSNVLREHIEALNSQLAETTRRLDESELAREQSQQQFEILQASTRRHGGATIVANTSLGRRLTAVQVPGVEVQQDGDVVRMSLPVDELFLAGTTTLQAQAAERIDRVAKAIAGAYPRHIIGIEGHTDNRPVSSPWQNQHQMTAAQAMAVLNRVTQTGQIPTDHLFVLGHGANQPIVSNATLVGKSKNRRIELVIYPETR